MISCIGFLFAFAWFLVSRGAKYWQDNWEAQVDLLEGEVLGPLFKTNLKRSPRFGMFSCPLVTGFHNRLEICFGPAVLNRLHLGETYDEHQIPDPVASGRVARRRRLFEGEGDVRG